MDACPACTASMRDAKPHCENGPCTWLQCGKCRSVIDTETGTYWRGETLWGNKDGYLKAK